jgi:hypothetical protein
MTTMIFACILHYLALFRLMLSQARAGAGLPNFSQPSLLQPLPAPPPPSIIDSGCFAGSLAAAEGAVRACPFLPLVWTQLADACVHWALLLESQEAAPGASLSHVHLVCGHCACSFCHRPPENEAKAETKSKKPREPPRNGLIPASSDSLASQAVSNTATNAVPVPEGEWRDEAALTNEKRTVVDLPGDDFDTPLEDTKGPSVYEDWPTGAELSAEAKEALVRECTAIRAKLTPAGTCYRLAWLSLHRCLRVIALAEKQQLEQTRYSMPQYAMWRAQTARAIAGLEKWRHPWFEPGQRATRG